MGLLRILIALYALFLIVGGVIGYTRSRSAASLVAGTLFGALELGAFVLAFGRPHLAYLSGATVAALVALSTAPRFLKNPSRIFPTGLLLLLSILVTALLGIGAARG